MYKSIWFFNLRSQSSRLDLSSNNGLKKTTVISRSVSLDHLVEGLVVAIKEGFLHLNQVNLEQM